MQLDLFQQHPKSVTLKTLAVMSRVVRRTDLVTCVRLALCSLCLVGPVFAEDTKLSASGALPEAPSALLAEQTSTPARAASAPDVAKKYRRVIKAGQQAVPLSPRDKIALAVLDRASISAVAGSAFSAAWGDWFNSTPHYGVDLGAYGQRFGAADLKATTESFFSYGLYASAFHDDPRYYVMGRKEKITKRAIYSASRVLITRKDDGDSAVNWAKLAGLTSAAALANAYYPEQDRRVGRTATSVLTSIATTAGTNEIHEFLDDAIHLVFHKHPGSDGK